jgi:conjugative transposon TraK protein
MEFKSLKNIESSFRQIRLFGIVFLSLCAVITVWSVWSSYRFAERQREKIYVLDNGKSLMLALSQDLSQNRPAEAREHVRRFHELFFTLSPEKSAIEHNVKRALLLADKSVYNYYSDFKNQRIMNILNNKNKRTSIFKALALCLFAAVSFTFVSCDDDMDIQQSYPFTVETMPVPNKVTKGQTVEIRCELKKTGDFANTLYTIRYFQFEGEGTLKMDNGITFLPNDRYLLENEKFRLYYTAQGDEAHNFIVVVEDNFGNSYELEFDFNNRNVKDDGVITVVPIGNFKPFTR